MLFFFIMEIVCVFGFCGWRFGLLIGRLRVGLVKWFVVVFVRVFGVLIGSSGSVRIVLIISCVFFVR